MSSLLLVNFFVSCLFLFFNGLKSSGESSHEFALIRCKAANAKFGSCGVCCTIAGSDWFTMWWFGISTSLSTNVSLSSSSSSSSSFSVCSSVAMVSIPVPVVDPRWSSDKPKISKLGAPGAGRRCMRAWLAMNIKNASFLLFCSWLMSRNG